ncbi:hypothetical protein JCM10296v2_006320 [Rhodotorula toruloides]
MGKKRVDDTSAGEQSGAESEQAVAKKGKGGKAKAVKVDEETRKLFAALAKRRYQDFVDANMLDKKKNPSTSIGALRQNPAERELIAKWSFPTLKEGTEPKDQVGVELREAVTAEIKKGRSYEGCRGLFDRACQQAKKDYLEAHSSLTEEDFLKLKMPRSYSDTESSAEESI